MGRPHSHGLEGQAGTQSCVRGGTDYFLGPCPVLNWQVIVELHVHVYFLELF